MSFENEMSIPSIITSEAEAEREKKERANTLKSGE